MQACCCRPRVVTLPPAVVKLTMKERKNMATLDWSQCSAVESVPGRLSGAWVFRDTRMPVSAVFENLEAGATIDEIADWFYISKDQIIEVLEFVALSLDPASTPSAPAIFTEPAARLFLKGRQ
jgi:uncharacterized protein (DUF433 family)